jgi:hypothetical protein
LKTCNDYLKKKKIIEFLTLQNTFAKMPCKYFKFFLIQTKKAVQVQYKWLPKIETMFSKLLA